MTNHEPKPANPLYVTLLACIGWIGLPIALALRSWYVSQHDIGDYFLGEGLMDVLEYWLFAGALTVGLDTFRRKTDMELGVWAIAAIAFGVSLLAMGADFVMRTYATFWPGETGALFVDVISLVLWIPAVLIWYGTMLFGTPIYSVFLTNQAICAWRAFFSGQVT